MASERERIAYQLVRAAPNVRYPDLMALADAVQAEIAAEREACAKVAEEMAESFAWCRDVNGVAASAEAATAESIAAKIRARG